MPPRGGFYAPIVQGVVGVSIEVCVLLLHCGNPNNIARGRAFVSGRLLTSSMKIPERGGVPAYYNAFGGGYGTLRFVRTAFLV